MSWNFAPAAPARFISTTCSRRQRYKRLKAFLLESTIWHDFSHIGGFVASYLEDGLACPLILQIADEIRGAFAALLAGHPLTQAWAFKGLKPSSTIDVHADDGAISVNFWITPSAANLKPERGGYGRQTGPAAARLAHEGL